MGEVLVMRRSLLLAGCLLTALAVPASAADAVPVPTASVVMTVAGRAVPSPQSTATWSVASPGRRATLTVAALNVAGAVTTADALWTSHDFLPPARGTALSVGAALEHAGQPTSSMPAELRFGLRYRAAGGHWSAWQDSSSSYDTGLHVVQSGGGGVAISFLGYDSTRVQLQLRVHVLLADLGRESETWSVTTAR